LAGEFPNQLAGSLREHYGEVARKELADSLASPQKPDFPHLFERYAKAEADKLQQVRRHLIEKRNIPATILDDVIRRGDLWGNARGSSVFAHRDVTGALRGCSIRGITDDFEQRLGDQTTAWFSIGGPLQSPGTLILVGSPIDAMSFQELNPLAADETVISTGGQTRADPLVAFGRSLLLAQNNDRAGEEQAGAFATAAQRAHLRAERLLPENGRNWNENLTTKIDDLRRISQETAEREHAAARTDREAELRKRETASAAQAPEASLPAHRAVSHSGGLNRSDRGRDR
jgi:hypothetical protein